MTTVSTTTTFSLPAGQAVCFLVGGRGTATVDPTGRGNIYTIGQQEAVIGPFAKAVNILVTPESEVSYRIDTDGNMDDQTPPFDRTLMLSGGDGLTLGGQALTAEQAEKVRGFISVEDFGAVGDGSTINDTALQNAAAYCALRAAAGNTTKLVWPAGRYVFSTSPNFAIDRLHMSFEGEVWLIATGAGSYALMLDGGASGDGVYGMRITGYPKLHGPSNGSHACYARAVHRSHLEINARGAGEISSMLYAEWLVSNTIFFIANWNEGGFSSIPENGITLKSRGVGEESSYNTFINPECSGLALGVLFDGALGNMFIGGAVQACDLGAELTANAWENKFIGTDFEANDLDVSDGARRTNYIACDIEALIDIEPTSVGARMVGGRMESINIKEGAKNVLIDTSYNRTGSGTIVDNGTKTAYGSVLNVSTEEYVGAAKSDTGLTATTGEWIWTNTATSAATISIAGGTVEYIALAHGGSAHVTGAVAGAFVIPAGSSIAVGNSVAPTVRLLSGGRY